MTNTLLSFLYFGDLMKWSGLPRVILLNFISSLIISIVVCYILYTYGLTEVFYIGNLFGLYFFTIYGVKILVEAGKIPNNYYRFLVVLLYILIFDIVFMALIPVIFGPKALITYDYLIFANGNDPSSVFKFNLSPIFYLTIFAIIMMIFNFILYRIEKKYY